MTAPWPAPGYPAAPPPALVPQQGTGLRVLRVILVLMLFGGWFWDSVGGGTADPTATGQTVLTVSWNGGSGIASLATLILLVFGPQPRWATKWAWFWLLGVGPMSAVFLLLEPVPVWQAEPAFARTRRLTGGWAFLLALFSGAILGALAALVVLPWLAVMGSPWGVLAPGAWFGR